MLENIICKQDLETSLITVKDWFRKNIKILDEEIQDVEKSIPSPCVCTLTSESDYNSMILRTLYEDVKLPELSINGSGIVFEKENTVFVNFNLKNNSENVIECGVFAYTEEDAEHSDIETIKTGTKMTGADNVGHLVGYTVDIEDNGNGVAYLPYAIVQIGSKQMTVYGDKSGYSRIKDLEDSLKYPESFKIIDVESRIQDISSLSVNFNIKVGFKNDSSEFVNTHSRYHGTDIEPAVVIKSDNYSTTFNHYHVNPVEIIMSSLIYFYLTEDDLNYYYQHVWCNSTGYDVSNIVLQGPKHYFNWQVLSAFLYKTKGYDMEIQESEGRAYVNANLDYKVIDKNRAKISISNLGDLPKENLDYALFYLTDDIEDPYEVFPTCSGKHPDPEIVKTMDMGYLTREPSKGVYIGAMFFLPIFNESDVLNNPKQYENEKLKFYQTTRLVHIPAEEFDSAGVPLF